MEMQQLVTVAEQLQLPDQGYNLGQYRGNGGTPYAPPESINEHRVENGVDNYRSHRRIHGFLGMTGRTQDRIQPQIEMGDGIAYKDNLHVVACIRQCSFACTEEIQDRIEKS